MFWEKVLASGVLLLGCSSALWRYRTSTKNYVIFNTRTTIYLEYDGNDFIEWVTPSICPVKNKSAPYTEMFCTSQGIHSIKPKIKNKPPNAEERHLFVDRSTDCFLWYFLARTYRFGYMIQKMRVPLSWLAGHQILQSLPSHLACSFSVWDKNLIFCQQSLMMFTIHISPMKKDYYGNGVIKMYNNKMLYFKIEITRVTQLHQWAKKSDNTLLLINPTGELFLANIKHGKAEFSEYPLMLELYSSTYEEHTSCPYMLFESSMILRNIYLDKRKQLTFWVQVIYRENNGVYPIVEIYGPNILKEKRYGDYEIASGICTKNMTVTFYQDIDYEGIENYYNIQDENMGHVMIQLRPSHFSKTCLLSNKAIHVFVGCFAERHLKVRGYSNTECHYTNNSYVIEKKYLSGNQPKDMYVNYSVSQYGCPLKVPMTEKFQPVLLLYDAGKLVEEVEANFVLWEIFGRNDFGYELSMSEAGCVNEAQSWQSMISKNKDLPIEEVWGPHNYRHCFSFSIGKPGDLLKPYEIFNLTNKNKIVWKNHHVGLYVFQAKIIDPNYSFCNLTVTFAVETFGILPETNPLLVLFFMIILLFFVIICLIVSYFRYLKFFRKFLYEPSLESKRKKKQKQ
ncbi:cation channel sperm-associated auxiliary subunit epsilon isoform X3 [Notamacropus eugenii]|uniref:cation channel sperm-associated auxiliary subunit epsilon isoform X3 n=1 Tax=Notamacropus eugenii TaxID=9315 RepID=UPI003B684232